MKSNPIPNRGVARKWRGWLLGLIGQAAVLPALAAPNPSLTGTVASININDTQTATVFQNAIVSAGGTNWITVTVDFNATSLGTLSPLPSGVVKSGTNYIIGPDTDTNVTATLNQLVFTPVANYIPVPNSSNAVFHVKAVDADSGSSALRTTTVTIASLNDAPTFSVAGTTSITDKQTNKPFSNISLSDPDNQGAQSQTITLTLTHTNTGYLVVGASGFASNNLAYTYTGAPNTVSNAMKALVYQPVENALPVGLSDTNFFRVVDSDGYASVTNSSVSVTVLSINDAPSMSGAPSNHVAVATGHSLSPSPFQTITLRDPDQNDDTNDPNGQSLLWNVTLTGPEPLGQLLVSGNPIGTSYGGSNEPPNATTLIRTLNYLPPLQAIGGTNTLTNTITINDQHGGLTTNFIYIDLYSIVLPPGLTGTQSGQTVYDNTTIAPFSKVAIASHNGNPVTVNIQLGGGATNDIQGQFINLGSFTQTTPPGQPSVYAFSGTSEAATAAIEALLFQPTANRINGSSTDTATFGLQLIDGVITNAPDYSTTVTIVPVNDAPTIFGVSPLVTIQDDQTIACFNTVLVGDVDEGGQQTNNCTILLDTWAKGSFSTNSLIASGFTNTGSSYTFSGMPSAISTAIRKLVFVPTPNRVPVGLTETTVFSIIMDDAHGGHVVNNGTSVRVSAVSGKPVISLPSPQPVSLPAATNVFAFSQVSIIDSTLLKVALRINDTTQGTFRSNSLTFSNGIVFTNLGGGNYLTAGYATNITPALQNIAFVPATNLPFGAVISFGISVTNALPNYTVVTHSMVLRTVRNAYIVTKLTDYDPTDVSVPANLKLGTLRNAIANARSGDHITFDIRSGVAGIPDYPAVIRLVAPITLNNDLTFDGPGAERLTISGDSNADGTPDTGLFTVNAGVVVNRLAFAGGYSPFAGGAFEVASGGSLQLSYCAVTGCQSDQWGGGVDVDGGTLSVDHCLFADNSTSAALGMGGGAISLYTSHACTIYDTTFAGNSQNAVSGLGGGALYAETDNAGTEFDVNIVHCSFRDNYDAGGQGSSIRPENNNTYVRIQNSILADGYGKNIEMDETGYVVSLGGNISDDDTYSIFSIGGGALNNHVFNPPLDQTNVPASVIFASLADNYGPTMTCALADGSPALNNSVSNTPAGAFYSLQGTDQRGYFRTNIADIGAFETGAGQRVIIEEIGFNPPTNMTSQFIEFFVPRDSTPLDLGGFKVLVDGGLRHTFTSQLLQPGEAMVLLSAGSTDSVPIAYQIATSNLALSSEGGIITLLNPSNQPVFQADYVGAYVSNDPLETNYLSTTHQTIMLSPQFQGVFLPFQLTANAAGLSNVWQSAGRDAGNKPLNGANATPAAWPDVATTDAHTVIPELPVLANDIDPDIADTLGVVWVGTNSTAGVTNLIGYSALGAMLTINSNGASINYDPTTSANLQSLPQGAITNDSFQYTILDFLNQVPHDRTNVTDTDYAANLAKATATVTLTVFGVNTAPEPQADNYPATPVLTTPEDTVLDFTTANTILTNDIDVNSDDDSSTLKIISICATNGFVPNATNLTTALGASVGLDIRFDRNETHIVYDPRGSAVLNALKSSDSAEDTFYYTVQDSHGATGTAAITIHVTGVNDGPTANADAFATDEDTPVVMAKTFFLANDTDPDNGDTLDITNVTSLSALGASVTIVGTNLVYDPTVSATLNALAQKEFATDTFTYTVNDAGGFTSNAVVTVQVAGVNDHPVSAADFYTTNEDSFLTVSGVDGVLSNDFDFDTHDRLRVIPFAINSATNCYTDPSGGAPVTMAADGSYTFDPQGYFNWLKQGEIYDDTFQYVVMDHSLSIAGDDNFSVNTATSNNILPVLANDFVLSGVGGAFSVVGVSTPDHGGTVSINASSNAVIYTPAEGYVGPETFTYTNSDGLGATDWATVTIHVAGSTLYALPDDYTVAKGTTNVLNLLANDTIIPATGASVSITALGVPDHGGTVTFNGTGDNNAVNYTPNPNTNAPYVETFSYVITSGSLTATGQVTVTVQDRANTLSLAANNDRFTVIAGSGNNVLDVLTNDLILPGTVSNLFLTGFTTNNLTGTVSLNAAHTRILYKPGAGITNQAETFTYYFADGAGGTGSASVLVQVTPSGFVANDDSFYVYKNSSNTLAVMINDVMLPNLGQTLFISGIGIGTNAPTHGTVTINGAGTGLIYVPTAGYNGNDDFTYEITDGSPSRALSHVHVTILDNSPAASNPDVYRVARESADNPLFVLANDYSLPVKPGALTITGLLTNGVHATVSVNGAAANNSLLYTPAAGFIGLDQFSYVFTDNYGNMGTNLVAVTVGDLVPRDDGFNAVSDTTNNVLDVRANDYSFPDTNALRKIYSLGTPDQGGSVTVNSNSTLVLYSPASGFTGTEHFSYQLADDTTNLFAANVTVNVRRAGSDRDTNSVTIAVVGVNDLPTIVGAQNHFHITDKQTTQPFTNVVIGDLDECGYQTNTVTVLLDNAVKGVLTNLGGFISIAPGVYQMQDSPPAITESLKTLVFVPTENRIIVPTSELTTFTIVANDGYGVSQTNNTTTVLVDSVNDAPTTAGATASSITDKQTVNPFAGIVVGEVDDSTLQALTVHITLDHVDNQTLTNLGGFTEVTGGLFVMDGTAADITTALRGITFVPVENHIKVPTTETTRLTLTVDDHFADTVTNADTTVAVTAVNDSPTTAGADHYFITDKQTVNPFATILIADVDDDAAQALTVNLSLDHLDNQTLTNLGGFTEVTNGLFTMTDTPTNITEALRGIVFVPTPDHIPVPTLETTRLTLTVDDTFAPVVTNALTTVTITATNDAPTFAGNQNYSISDKQTVKPFATLTVADQDDDGLQPLTVQLAVDNLDKGSLTNLGGFAEISTGLYELFGTPANLTTALRGMVYVPVPNHIPVPTTVPIHFNLSAADAYVVTPTTNQTIVSVTASNDAPVITGTVSNQLVYNRSFIKPFAGALITEVDNDRTQALRITVTIDDPAKGNLSALGGFTDLGGGVYSLGASNGTVTAAIATTALRGLLFTPTTGIRVTPTVSETTRFTIAVDDFYAPTVTDSNTTVVAIHPFSAKVTAADRTALAQFGWAVSATRDLAVIGAPHDPLDTNAGSAYLFARSLDGSNTWTQIKKLVPPDGRDSDAFGTSVSIDGDFVLVGAPLRDQIGVDSGAAYLYARNQGGTDQWGFVKKFTSSDLGAGDQFGNSVFVSSNDIVIGAPLVDSTGKLDTGAAYVFARNQGGADQWGQVKKLVSGDPIANDHFGLPVRMNGDTIVAGSSLTEVSGLNDSGAAYVFERNLGGAAQWGQSKKLVPSDPFPNDHFGTALSINADTIVVGSPLADAAGLTDSGAAYVYNRNLGGSNQWGQVKKLISPEPYPNDHFGGSVSVYADMLVVGSPLADANGVDSGTAYLFGQNQNGTNAWGQVDKFLPPGVGAGDTFGCSVYLNRGTVVVGAYSGYDTSARFGAAFMFRIKYNNAPEVLSPLPDQLVLPGSVLSFAVPAGTFSDPDVNETLQLSLAGNPAPPVWLNFNPLTGAFSGTVGVTGTYPVAVVATDSDGATVTNQFSIIVMPGPVNNSSLSLGFQNFGGSQLTVIRLTGTAGATYKLQCSPSLSADAVWTDVATGMADQTGAITFYDLSNAQCMFYRTVLQ